MAQVAAMAKTLARTRPRPPRRGAVSVWLFDLDNTLYPAGCRLFDQIERRMTDFICRALGVDEAGAHGLRRRYWQDHGTTLRGRMTHHAVDPDAFLDFVHDIDLTVVAPSPPLDQALAALDGRKLVFTNGSQAHAERVLARLGIGHHFEAIFDIVAADHVPKPEPAVYGRLIERHAVDPSRAVMFDDIAINLRPAAELGMTTVWVRAPISAGAGGHDRGDQAVDHVDHVAEDLCDWLSGLDES